MWLTDDLLFNYQRCHRRAFLDVFGDLSQRDPPSDYLLKLRQDSAEHRRTVLGKAIDRPDYPHHDWAAGAAATQALMAQGVDQIVGGVLTFDREDGVTLVSCPDLLNKQPGSSIWGDWCYVPTDIKLGKRPKLDYQITAAFHAYVLATVQGGLPETSWLILRQRGAYAVNLTELLPRLEEVLEGCAAMLLAQQEPEVFISHSRCDLCPWLTHCYGIAQAEQHLSLMPGVTPSRYVHLQALQMVTVESLAIAVPKQLEPLPGFGWHVADKLVRQAKALLENRAIPIPQVLSIADRAAPRLAMPLLLPEELPTAPIELYYDIEAAPEHNLVYLHGVLVVDRVARTETFYALLADRPEAEGEIWQQFLALMWQYPDAPIFHFCPYEVQTIQRLADYYGTPKKLIQPLLARSIDLHERVTRVATLPVESYALKPIARWLGFDWRDAEANGAQSIYWYAQWLSTGDRAFLDAILRYNEDDCRATHCVKDWLVEFVQTVAGQQNLLA